MRIAFEETLIKIAGAARFDIAGDRDSRDHVFTFPAL